MSNSKLIDSVGAQFDLYSFDTVKKIFYRVRKSVQGDCSEEDNAFAFGKVKGQIILNTAVGWRIKILLDQTNSGSAHRSVRKTLMHLREEEICNQKIYTNYIVLCRLLHNPRSHRYN